MKRSRFSEEQIVGILKEHEAGVPVADLCRKHGVSDASIYKWRAKFGGMEVSEAKRLKTLEDENARLKRLLTFHSAPPGSMSLLQVSTHSEEVQVQHRPAPSRRAGS